VKFRKLQSSSCQTYGGTHVRRAAIEDRFQ
jgi:hypothetical protein